MAKRSLNSVWQQLENIYKSVCNGKSSREEACDLVEELIAKDDVQAIFKELGQILMLDYTEYEGATFRLVSPRPLADDTGLPTSYDTKEKVMSLNPFRAMAFIDEAKGMPTSIAAGEFREDYELFRRNSFVAEIAKLPSKCILFMMVFQEIASSEGLTHIGLSDGPDISVEATPFYQTFLWSFCELEKKLYQMNGISVRSQYNIIWHESEWISLP